MTQNAPEIEKVQYNVPGTEHSFAGSESVDQEYYEHMGADDWAARIVLENGNWLEYRKVGEETMEECLFLQEQHPDGQYEAFLHDSVEITSIDLEYPAGLWRAVDESLKIYQIEIDTVADARKQWDTIVPAVKGE